MKIDQNNHDDNNGDDYCDGVVADLGTWSQFPTMSVMTKWELEHTG